MKKQRVKNLELQKRVISSFDLKKVKGGYSHSNIQQGTQEHCCHRL